MGWSLLVRESNQIVNFFDSIIYETVEFDLFAVGHFLLTGR
jgi:hypothetical protein